MEKDEFKVFVKCMNSLFSTNEKPLIGDQYKFDLWFSMLKDLEYKKACDALKNYAMLNRFPPTVADIRKEAATLSMTAPEMTEQEAWAKVRLAIRNGSYGAESEFEALPEEIQKAVGTAASIRSWAQMPTDDVESVIQSQFLRSYRTVMQRKQENAILGVLGTQRGMLIENIAERLKIEEK